MKHKSLLYRLSEAEDKVKERLGARIRKRRQRARDDAETKVNPFANILVVRNKMNGEILIIDRESYTPKYHEIILSPDKINQAAVKEILDDPKFVQTETSKRLFGDIKRDSGSGEKQVATKEESPSGDEESSSSGGSSGPSVAPAPPAPVKEIPFTAANINSGPIIAIGMMGGLQGKDLLKFGITPEQLDEYNSSKEIQDVSMQIARQLAYYFKSLVGRDILEYTPMVIKDQLFETTKFWKSMGGYDSLPKSNIVFRHKCVEESQKDTNCKDGSCGCSAAGIVPSEQVVSFTIKYGQSSVLNGKLNNEAQTIFYSTINLIDSILQNRGPKDLVLSLDEKEKHDLKKLESDIEFLKKISIDTVDSKLLKNPGYKQDNEERIKAINELCEKIKGKIERIINSNIVHKTLFLNEAITGYVKFTKQSPAYAQGMIAVVPDNFNILVEMIDLNFSRKILDNDIHFVINLKTSMEETPDEQASLEACKIRFGGKCPKIIDPRKFLVRQLLKSMVVENKFSHSSLNVLFEQTDADTAIFEFKESIESAQGLQDLMNIFGIQPAQITIEPIDYYSVTAVDYSSEKNIVKVNGKRFEIPVQIPTVLPDDAESVIESHNLIKTLLEKKKRNYRKEYDNYHGKAEQRANRSKRVLARRKMMKAGLVKKGDGKDVDHKDGNPQNNSRNNLRVRDKSKNRADR